MNEFKILAKELTSIRKKSIISGILDHYEHYNGKGCPKGKRESDINLFALLTPENPGKERYTKRFHPF